MYAQSPVFGDIPYHLYDNYYITDKYDSSSIIPRNNEHTNYWNGWNFLWTPDNIFLFGHGLYKFSSSDNKTHFYIDYRDDKYVFYNNSYGHNADLWIKYNDIENKFYYASSPDLGFVPISNGDYLKIWEIKQQGLPTTSKFINFWQNCLAIIPTSNNHPRLVWGRYPSNDAVSIYKIYRKYGRDEWKLYDQVSNNTFEYIDNQINILTGMLSGIAVQYKVTAQLSTVESLPTNIQETKVKTLEALKENYGNNNDDINNSINYSLDQNYPNPFNPNTKISFNIKESGFVNLTIYNSLGKEIKNLVNENLERGNYTVDFNAENLPSGIYFYKLQTGNFVDIKKMLLVK